MLSHSVFESYFQVMILGGEVPQTKHLEENSSMSRWAAIGTFIDTGSKLNSSPGGCSVL